jgi:hypothetical protein
MEFNLHIAEEQHDSTARMVSVVGTHLVKLVDQGLISVLQFQQVGLSLFGLGCKDWGI